MNFGRFCESGFWMAKVAMNRMSEGNTFYGRKLHITSYVAGNNPKQPSIATAERAERVDWSCEYLLVEHGV